MVAVAAADLTKIAAMGSTADLSTMRAMITIMIMIWWWEAGVYRLHINAYILKYIRILSAERRIKCKCEREQNWNII